MAHPLLMQTAKIPHVMGDDQSVVLLRIGELRAIGRTEDACRSSGCYSQSAKREQWHNAMIHALIQIEKRTGHHVSPSSVFSEIYPSISTR